MRIDSRHLVDPQLLPLLESFPPLELTADLLPALRAVELPLASAAGDEARLVDVVERRVAGPTGAPDVGLMIYRPRGQVEPLPCVLHMHGGGFVLGAAGAMQAVHEKLAVAAHCVIVSVDYRLAPDTLFPGAVEDCYAALVWVHANAAELGIDGGKVGVMGESAGGGLAAALALLARDRHAPAIAFQHLIYPMLDDRTCIREDPQPYAGEFLWTPANNAFGWAALLGVPAGSAGVSQYAAPARAADLAGLPAAFISCGTLDLFVEEDLEYARRLIRGGVPVELHLYPGAYHGFDLSPDAQVAMDARRDSLTALRRALGHP